MHKRRLLAGGVAVALASLYVSAIGRGVNKACGVIDGDVGALDLQPLIRIGRIYLEELTKSRSAKASRKDLLADLLAADNLLEIELHAMMGKVHEEFGRGETVTCDGWVLSKSEARLCAVIALIDGYSKSS
jgi:hypothetical protein